MLEPRSQIESFLNLSWNKTKPLFFVLLLLFLFVVCMKCARIGNSNLLTSASLGIGGYQIAPEILLQQATGTHTSSPTSSATQTTTFTATASLTITPTLDTPTFTPTATYISPTIQTPHTPLPTLLHRPHLFFHHRLLKLCSFWRLETTRSPSITTTLDSSIASITATATLIPFPAIHLDLPSLTPTPHLNYLEHLDGSTKITKGRRTFFAWIKPYWLLILIFVIWGDRWNLVCDRASPGPARTMSIILSGDYATR